MNRPLTVLALLLGLDLVACNVPEPSAGSTFPEVSSHPSNAEGPPAARAPSATTPEMPSSAKASAPERPALPYGAPSPDAPVPPSSTAPTGDAPAPIAEQSASSGEEKPSATFASSSDESAPPPGLTVAPTDPVADAPLDTPVVALTPDITDTSDTTVAAVDPIVPTDPVAPPPDAPAPVPGTTYDITTGLGFAAKGDVQSAFGWNDAALTNALCSSVSGSANRCAAFYVPQNLHVWFTLEAHDVYRATCQFTTGPDWNETVHEISIPKHTYIDSAITSAARASGAKFITGFNLNGPILTTYGTKIPVVGDPCVGENGNAQDGTWSAVELVSSNGGLGLWAHTDLAALVSSAELWQL